MQSTTATLAAMSAAQVLTHAHAAETPAKKIGFAFVGLGRFATRQLMPAIAESNHLRMAGLVTGTPEKAKKFGEQYQIDPKSIYSYENFDQIKDNSDIDVVYVVLPNSMHAEYTVRAANAGKHVMCEKPMAVTVEECQQMIDACKKNNRKLSIGYRLRYEPYNMKAIEIVQQKTYGPLRVIESNHSFVIGQNEWRTDFKMSGGGPVMDVGIYSLNFSRYVTGEEPTHVTAQTWQPKDDPRFVNTDATMVFSLKFPSGVMSNCATSYVSNGGNAILRAENAIVTLEPAFGYGGIKMKIRAGKEENVQLPQVNQFAAEMDHFAECIMNNTEPRTPGEDGLADVKIMRKLYEAAESGKTVAV
jgi:glucose-fructose oxidoreductase